MNIDKLASWYRVSTIPYLGPVRFRALFERIGSDVEQIFREPEEDLSTWKGIFSKQILQGLKQNKVKSKEEVQAFAKKQAKLAKKCGGDIVFLDDPEYPDFLKRSTMCHPIVYYVGDLKRFTKYDKSIAVVGTRGASEKSIQIAKKTAKNLAKKGWVIVSGMASGIDSAAHYGCIEGKGKTIAVLGCGPDIVYPPDANDLYGKLRDKQLILSEFPFGTRIEGWKLKKRNKTTVALSFGAFVVQTTANGGSMNAVQACKEQKKVVFTVLHGRTKDFSGNKKIADSGGVVVKDADAAASISEFYSKGQIDLDLWGGQTSNNRKKVPKTVEQAVDRLVSEMSLRDKTEIANMREDELVDLHVSVGIYIRNEFRLWEKNEALVKSCRSVSGKDRLDVDDASSVIIRELWKRIRTTRSKIVK